MSKEQNFEELLRKYLENSCTPEESQQLLEWLAKEENNSGQASLIRKALEAGGTNSNIDQHQLEHQLRKVFETISRKIQKGEVEKAKVKRLNWVRRLAVAASIAAVMCTVIYLFIQYNRTSQTADISQPVAQHDLAPGGNKAILTLHDGSELVLEDARNGDLAKQGSATIIKQDGQLIYNKNADPASVLYNSITTPRGGQYQLTLVDGSKVWLNAASSIRFPTAFPGKERTIEITGEAYFEIAKDVSKPFKVKFETPSGNKTEVVVLGTHFNIMCYKDEKTAKTTLLEGSVKILGEGKTAILKPAQQAKLKEGEMEVISNVDTEETIAWKNGFFQFNSANLQQVMRQVARWYDVEISYEGDIPKRRFGGKISRDNNASEVLKILELSLVKFRIENKKIIVMN